MSKKRKSPPKKQTGKQLNLFGEPSEAPKPEKLVNKPEPIKKAATKKKIDDLSESLKIAADTKQLINEPEFNGFYFQPIEFAYEIGPLLSPAGVIDLTKLKKSEKKEVMGLIDAMLDQEYFFENWVDRLEFLLIRAKDQGKNDLVAKVAAILKLIEEGTTIEEFFSVGLFTALLDRNISLGLDFLELYDSGLGHKLAEKMPGAGDLDSELSEAFVSLDKKYPGLVDYLEATMNVSDSINDFADLFAERKILLGIFSFKQLQEINSVLKEYLEENFGLGAGEEPFFYGLNQLSEQQLVEFQLFLNKLMERYVTDDLLDIIFERVKEILTDNLEQMDDDLIDLLDEFLEQFDSMGYMEILTLLSSIFIGELAEFYERLYKKGPSGNSNIFPLN